MRTITLNLSLMDTFYMNGPCTRQGPRKEASRVLDDVSWRYRVRMQYHSHSWPKKLGQSLRMKGGISVQIETMFCAIEHYLEFLRQYFTGGSNSHANFIYVDSKKSESINRYEGSIII